MKLKPKMSLSRFKSKFPWKLSGLLLIKLKFAEVRNSALELQTFTNGT